MFPRIPARKALCTGASQHPRSSSIRLAEDDDSQRFFFRQEDGEQTDQTDQTGGVTMYPLVN